jgi:hypothetical protein
MPAAEEAALPFDLLCPFMYAVTLGLTSANAMVALSGLFLIALATASSASFCLLCMASARMCLAFSLAKSLCGGGGATSYAADCNHMAETAFEYYILY